MFRELKELKLLVPSVPFVPWLFMPVNNKYNYFVKNYKIDKNYSLLYNQTSL